MLQSPSTVANQYSYLIFAAHRCFQLGVNSTPASRGYLHRVHTVSKLYKMIEMNSLQADTGDEELYSLDVRADCLCER